MCRLKQAETNQRCSSEIHLEQLRGEEVEGFHNDEEKGHSKKTFVSVRTKLKGKFNKKSFLTLLILGRHYIFTKAYVGKMFGKSYKLQQLGENEKLGWGSR